MAVKRERDEDKPKASIFEAKMSQGLMLKQIVDALKVLTFADSFLLFCLLASFI